MTTITVMMMPIYIGMIYLDGDICAIYRNGINTVKGYCATTQFTAERIDFARMAGAVLTPERTGPIYYQWRERKEITEPDKTGIFVMENTHGNGSCLSDGFYLHEKEGEVFVRRNGDLKITWATYGTYQSINPVPVGARPSIPPVTGSSAGSKGPYSGGVLTRPINDTDLEITWLNSQPRTWVEACRDKVWEKVSYAEYFFGSKSDMIKVCKMWSIRDPFCSVSCMSYLTGVLSRRKRSKVQCHGFAITLYSSTFCDMSTVQEELEKEIKEKYNSINQRLDRDLSSFNRSSLELKEMLEDQENAFREYVASANKREELREIAWNATVETVNKQAADLLILQAEVTTNLGLLAARVEALTVERDAQMATSFILTQWRTNRNNRCSIRAYPVYDAYVATDRLMLPVTITKVDNSEFEKAVVTYLASQRNSTTRLVQVLNNTVKIDNDQLSLAIHGFENTNSALRVLNEALKDNSLKLARALKFTSTDTQIPASVFLMICGIALMVGGLCNFFFGHLGGLILMITLCVAGTALLVSSIVNSISLFSFF